MLADTLSSFVIVIGAVVIYFTNWNIIDPIFSIGIALAIFVWGLGLFKDSVNILLEATPKGLTTDKVSNVMKEVSAIKEITDLHIWEITSKMYSMTAHIKLKEEVKEAGTKTLLTKIKEILDEQFDIEHSTIEFE